jgi:FkbM family methyltransferase
MAPSISSLLTRLCRTLPPRLGASFYYRVISRMDMGDSPYQGAPLAFAPGFKMNLMRGDSCHGSIAFSGCYELPLTNRLCEIAKSERGTLIDAGANYGYYSLLWTAAAPNNRVIAFEASPRNFPALTANLVLNGVSRRVDARNKAVGDKVGVAHFKMSAIEQSGWDKITSEASESNWSVPLTTLDSELEDREYTALKIDCEGYDHHVVLGARKLLEARRVKHVFFEENVSCSEKFGVAAGEIGRLLTGIGYTVSPLGGRTEFEATLR